MDGWIDKWTERRTDGWVDKWMDEYEWMGRQMMDGWREMMVGWPDG